MVKMDEIGFSNEKSLLRKELIVHLQSENKNTTKRLNSNG